MLHTLLVPKNMHADCRLAYYIPYFPRSILRTWADRWNLRLSKSYADIGKMSNDRSPVRRALTGCLCLVVMVLPTQMASARAHITAERLLRATLAEAESLLKDPALRDVSFIEPIFIALLARPELEQREYLLIRALDLLVLEQNGSPRAELLVPNDRVFQRLAERYYGFVDPSLRYRVLLLTADRDADAASKMVQHGFAHLLLRLTHGGNQLLASELQEALVMCQVAVRFPHPATALGAALIAERARIPELVHAARAAARATQTNPGDEKSE